MCGASSGSSNPAVTSDSVESDAGATVGPGRVGSPPSAIGNGPFASSAECRPTHTFGGAGTAAISASTRRISARRRASAAPSSAVRAASSSRRRRMDSCGGRRSAPLATSRQTSPSPETWMRYSPTNWKNGWSRFSTGGVLLKTTRSTIATSGSSTVSVLPAAMNRVFGSPSIACEASYAPSKSSIRRDVPLAVPPRAAFRGASPAVQTSNSAILKPAHASALRSVASQINRTNFAGVGSNVSTVPVRSTGGRVHAASSSAASPSARSRTAARAASISAWIARFRFCSGLSFAARSARNSGVASGRLPWRTPLKAAATR